MVNVSTLFYVLENLEGKDEELICLEEVQQLEENYLNRLFGLLDQAEMIPDPALVNKILQTASSQ
jgi:hypothetical protein